MKAEGGWFGAAPAANQATSTKFFAATFSPAKQNHPKSNNLRTSSAMKGMAHRLLEGGVPGLRNRNRRLDAPVSNQN
jgi:hypothetical protein